MKFIFDDSFAADFNLFKTENKLESVVLPSGLIFEKSVRLANVSDQDLQEMIDNYNSGNNDDKARIIADDYPKLDEGQRKEFVQRTSRGKSSGSVGEFSFGNDKSIPEKGISRMMDMSDITGEPSQKASRLLSDRNILVSQLRTILSEEEIGEVFELIRSKRFPESELHNILKDALQYSTESGTNFKTVLSFFVNHYDQQRDLHLTRDIAKLASEIKATNPDVNVFEMLSTAAVGQIPDIAMINLIDDDKMRNTVLTLISTSQLRIVEQNEAIRRNLQNVRDGLQAMEERTNLQTALVDALDTIEIDKTLTQEVEAFGSLFKRYMKSPTYRAFRNVLYQMKAARKLIDRWSTIVTDTQPITPRQTGLEQKGKPLGSSDLTQESEKDDARGLGRMNVNSPNSKFVKIAQAKQNAQSLVFRKQISDNFIDEIVNFYKNSRASFASKYPAEVMKGYDLISYYIEKSKNNPDYLNNLGTYVVSSLRTNRLSKTIYSQTTPQTGITGISADTTSDQAIQANNKKIEHFLNTIAYATKFTNPQALDELARFMNAYGQALNRQNELQSGAAGLPAPSQGFSAFQRMFVAANEEEVNNMIGLSREESFARMNLAKKRADYKTMFENKREILNKNIKMQVDLGDGTEGEAPYQTPEKIKALYEDMKVFLKEVIKNISYEKQLLQKGFNRISSRLDPFQSKKVQAKISEIEVDIRFYMNELNKISSTALIAADMARKQRLYQKLGPIQKKLSMLAKAGFTPSGLMFNMSFTDPGGQSMTYGSLLYSILNQEKKALATLQNAYQEARKSTTPVDLKQYLGKLTTEPQDLIV